MKLKRLLMHRAKNRKNTTEVEIYCADCGKKFKITIGDLCYYHEIGLLVPNLCKECRQEKKQEHKKSREEKIIEKENIEHSI